MSVCLNHCLKRFPRVSFPRYYASAAASRLPKNIVASDQEDADRPLKVKRRGTKHADPESEELKLPPPPNILEWSPIQDHLEQLAESNGKLVVADIERCRPRRHPLPGNPEYEEEYHKLIDKITGAFTRKQLRQFLKLYDIKLRADRRKEDYAEAIMVKQWNWPSLDEVREQKREEEIDVDSGLLPFQPIPTLKHYILQSFL
jgi:hypothetical protein